MNAAYLHVFHKDNCFFFLNPADM